MTVAHFTSTDIDRAGSRRRAATAIRIGLLGFGQVGSAVARLSAARPLSRHGDVGITAALVRDPLKPRATAGITVTTDPEEIFATRPSVIVEALGGLEPARTLVLEAIARGIPVVTANKSLLAHHGDELAAAAGLAGVSLRFEATVLAGVPFLGTFASRPYASALTSITGIVNGTTNFILSQMENGTKDYDSALADAQRRGFAEPDPSKDVEGIDAVEKLAILIRQFGGPSVEPWRVETTGIASVLPADLAHARELGGTLKPVVHAAELASDAPVAAFAGPAFVPERHPLARVHQALNGLCLRDIAGSQLCFTGPGAGPDVTAVTVLDDVVEAVVTPVRECWPTTERSGLTVSPATGWFVRVSSAGLPHGSDIANLLGAHGVWAERTTARDSRDGKSLAILTYPCARHRIERAAAALGASTGSTPRIFRALEPLT